MGPFGPARLSHRPCAPPTIGVRARCWWH